MRQLHRAMGLLGGAVRHVAFVVSLGVTVASGASAQTGTVFGTAARADGGDPLVGAVVAVDGTTLSAITGEAGNFVLTRVPAGQRTLTLTYIGHETQSRTVNVTAGATASAAFSVAVSPIVLEGITVRGSRAMVQAEALNRQRSAPNIVNVVASDQMARFPDASAPEAVQRIPGVAIQRDQGEGRYIQIRGGSAANTQVTFNGIQVPSPEGEARQIALDAVPVDLLESIEVSKALLPYMDADAIGGSVNLMTRSAPATRVLSAEASGGFGPLRSDPSGSAALTFGDRTADGSIGYLFNGSWNRRNFGSDDVEPIYDLGGPGLGDDVLEEHEVRHYSLRRQRMGGSAAFDYRFDEGSSIGLTGIYTNLTDTEQRRILFSAIGDDALEWLHKNREENLRTYGGILNGEHLLGSATLEWRGAWTRSEEDTPFDTEIAWVLDGVTFSPTIDDPSDVRSNPSTLTGDYLFDVIEPASSETRDTDLVGSFDLSLPFGLGSGSGTLKFGAKVRDKNKLQEIVEEEYENNGADIILGTDYGEAFDETLKHPGTFDLPGVGTSPDQVTDFVTTFNGQLDQTVNIEAETGDYDLDERVLAGYVMAELNLTPTVLLVPGVRYERTTVNTAGFDYDAATDALTPVSDEHEYGNVFPMIHARVAVTPNTNIRGAFTTSIQRPNFYDLVPYRIFDDPDMQLGNPDLDPVTARSFDLLLERYDDRIGVISAGAFYRDISDPIFLFTEDNTGGGETEQPRNGASGWIRGAEVAIQRQLVAGFGIYGNYTFTDSEGELPNGRTARLQGQAEHVFNAALSYERTAFTGQVSLNYHGDFVSEYADEDFEDVYIDDHLQLDLSASYQVTPSARLFLELVNLTNEPLVAYQGVRERPIQMEFYELWGRLGVRMAW